jgi:hypothetical protein
MTRSGRSAYYRLSLDIDEQLPLFSQPSDNGSISERTELRYTFSTSNSGGSEFLPHQDDVNSGGSEFLPHQDDVNSGGSEFLPHQDDVNSDDSEFSTFNSNVSNDPAWTELEEIASIARKSSRLSREEHSKIIIALCTRYPLSINELAYLINRDKDHLRSILRHLIKRGEIQYFYPNQPNHPEQKYIASL